MSEAEKQRRAEYRKNRRKWIFIQSAVLACALVFTLLWAVFYMAFSKAYYINYTEKSQVDYSVLLKEDKFFAGDYAEKDQAYIGSLIDEILADFKYELFMEADNVDFVYTYRIDVITRITDRSSGKVVKEIVRPGVPRKTLTAKGQSLMINESVRVDYDEPNQLAENLSSWYKLDGLESKLMLQLHMDVAGSCESFEDNAHNEYVVTLNVPLDTKIVNMSVESSVEDGQNQIIACENGVAKTVFLVLTIVFAVISVILAGLFVAFIILTRNTDINYEIKIKKIVSSYKSFIQRINNPFNEEGYQILMVDTFVEMLEIRDTINSPVLMNENEDKTCTRFLIPTNTKILYVFEVKVEDYDEIYAEPEEELVILEEVPTEELEEAIHTSDVALEDIDYVDVEVEDKKDGVEVIEVVWPERKKANKLYRYDPNGEELSDGDIVLVPSRDVIQNKDIIRKATVAHGNHRVDPEELKHPLKKIIAIVKRKTQDALSHSDKEN